LSGIVVGRQGFDSPRVVSEALPSRVPSDGTRALIEVELATLREELRATRRRRWRWFLWGGRL
jgi:hypothetical protein